MSEEKKAVRLNISLKPDVIDELDRMADLWGTTRSGMVTILIKLRSDQDKSISAVPLLQEFMSLKNEGQLN